ncbi:MAG: MerR family transcriptional regulator [Niabella sp.]
MAKSSSQSQGAFSFFDEVEKVAQLPKPQKNTLKPPQQIVIEEKDEGIQPNTARQTDPAPEPLSEEQPVPFVEDIPASGPIPVTEDVNTHEDAIQIEDRSGDDNSDTGTSPAIERKNSRGRRSVKENALAASRIEMPEEDVLFSKQYYSMGEVTAMFKENHSLIRYWESEFDILKPRKNGKGDRFFRPADVKNLYLIYDLLRRRKFTIEGAKEYLKSNKRAEEKFAAIQSLERIKAFFLELKATL